MYTLAYRNLGIFQENVVNRFLEDVVKACQPVRPAVTGDFTPRGGISTSITASWTREEADEGNMARKRDELSRRHSRRCASACAPASPTVRAPAEIPLPDLMPLVHARDAAEAKVAASAP